MSSLFQPAFVFQENIQRAFVLGFVPQPNLRDDETVPMRRALDGVLLLDKPLGLSSNQALGRAKYLLAAKKAGHTGTLDPLASGLLPLCFGEATKFSQDLLDATKRYEATLSLGARTTTGDAEGEVLQQRPVTCDLPAVQSALAQCRGDILQIPPMYSALKRDGKPLYEYARAGVTLERAARPATIYELNLLNWVLPDDDAATNSKESTTHTDSAVSGVSPQLPEFELQIAVSCSKGTYIRVLAEDIGELLGCGAHLTALRRTGVGTLNLAGSITLATLEAAEPEQRLRWLQPVDALLSTYPSVHLDAISATRFKQGQRLKWSAAWVFAVDNVAAPNHRFTNAAPDGLQIRVYDETAQFLGIANFFKEMLAPKRTMRS